ncbi:MAG: hypothetical protein IPP42_22425 [Saprospiraceae bacterium]|nr:hypothetical protein [Saprospiraceae bacterium]
MSNDPSANVCQGGVDTVEIFIDPAAVVDAGPGQRICGSVDTVALDGSYSAQLQVLFGAQLVAEALYLM